MKFAPMLFPFLAVAVGSSLRAQDVRFQDPQAIDQAVSAFVGGTPGTKAAGIRPVDRRLRLKPCHSPFTLSWHNGARHTVQVRCPDPDGWRLFVPVAGIPARAASDSAPVIGKGDPVTIRINGRGFTVTTTGEALEAGPAEGWVRIRAFGAKTQLRGQVVAPGVVAVPLP